MLTIARVAPPRLAAHAATALVPARAAAPASSAKPDLVIVCLDLVVCKEGFNRNAISNPLAEVGVVGFSSGASGEIAEIFGTTGCPIILQNFYSRSFSIEQGLF